MADLFQSTAFENVREDTVIDPPSAISEVRNLQEIQPSLSDCKLDSEPSEKPVLPLWTPTFFRIARKNRGMPPLSPLDVSGYGDERDVFESQARNTQREDYSNAYAQVYP